MRTLQNLSYIFYPFHKIEIAVISYKQPYIVLFYGLSLVRQACWFGTDQYGSTLHEKVILEDIYLLPGYFSSVVNEVQCIIISLKYLQLWIVFCHDPC